MQREGRHTDKQQQQMEDSGGKVSLKTESAGIFTTPESQKKRSIGGVLMK